MTVRARIAAVAAGAPAAPNGTGSTHSRRSPCLSVVHFLVSVLILLLVTLPFVDQLPNGDLVESVLLTLVLLSAVMAVGGRRNSLVAGVVLVTPAVLGRWIDHLRPDLIPADLSIVAAIVFVVFVIVHLLRFIMRVPRVNHEVLVRGHLDLPDAGRALDVRLHVGGTAGAGIVRLY